MNHAPLDVRDALAERQGAIGEIRALPVAGVPKDDGRAEAALIAVAGLLRNGGAA